MPAPETPQAEARKHVSRALKKYLRDNELTVRDFNERVLKVKPGSVVAYNWLAGRGLPGPEHRATLAAALGRSERFFMPRELTKGKAMSDTAEMGTDNDTPAENVSQMPSNIVHARAPRRVLVHPGQEIAPNRRNSLSFHTNGDGTATLVLSYTADRTAVQRLLTTLNDLDLDNQHSTRDTQLSA